MSDYLKHISSISALDSMLIKVLSYFLDHQEDSFSLLLHPSYSSLFFCNTFRSFALFQFIYFTQPTKDKRKQSHPKAAKTQKNRGKEQKYELFNKKVDFHLVDSIRNNKFAVENFTFSPLKIEKFQHFYG